MLPGVTEERPGDVRDLGCSGARMLPHAVWPRDCVEWWAVTYHPLATRVASGFERFSATWRDAGDAGVATIHTRRDGERGMMRFFTGLGDDGTTDLLGARVAKDDPRVDALGALDEA